MTNREMERKIEVLTEWENIIAEAQAQADAIKSEIKAEMEERNTEELECGQYIIRWTSVLSNRFDATAFKKIYANLYKEYTKQIASRRFSIA